MLLKQPLQTAERLDQYDIMATVKGGGLSGQAGAVRHGISKALTTLRTGVARCAQKGRLSDQGQPHGRAQEVRSQKGAPFVPVLESANAGYAALLHWSIGGYCPRSANVALLTVAAG